MALHVLSWRIVMLAKNPDTVIDLAKLSEESADYLRLQEDRNTFLSKVLLEHKRRTALRGLLDEHLADVPENAEGEDAVIRKMASLGG